jgi:hypothetical protein
MLSNSGSVSIKSNQVKSSQAIKSSQVKQSNSSKQSINHFKQGEESLFQLIRADIARAVDVASEEPDEVVITISVPIPRITMTVPVPPVPPFVGKPLELCLELFDVAVASTPVHRVLRTENFNSVNTCDVNVVEVFVLLLDFSTQYFFHVSLSKEVSNVGIVRFEFFEVKVKVFHVQVVRWISLFAFE